MAPLTKLLAFKPIIDILGISLSIAYAATAPTTNTQPPIRLTSDSTLNLTIFSDLHYGEDEATFGPSQDRGSSSIIRQTLSHNDTTLSILLGDLITGENTFPENSSEYVDTIAANFVEYDVPWTSVYGNHDGTFNSSRYEMWKKEKGYGLSYTGFFEGFSDGNGPPGLTNYFLLLYPFVGERAEELGWEERPVAVLWFFDSLGGGAYQRQYWETQEGDGDNWVNSQVVVWFRQQNAELRQKYGVLPSLAFVHIPCHAFRVFQDTKFRGSNYPGQNKDIPLNAQGDGDEGYLGQDVEFMQALVDTEGLHSIHSGHDHGNAWCGTWPEMPSLTPGISKPFICFSKHSGMGGYGSWARGARTINLSFHNETGKSEMKVDTWVRMSNGRINTRVSLNGTYGTDVY